MVNAASVDGVLERVGGLFGFSHNPGSGADAAAAAPATDGVRPGSQLSALSNVARRRRDSVTVGCQYAVDWF